MPEKLITKSFERLLDKGKHRGFITYEELGKSLGKRNSTNENVKEGMTTGNETGMMFRVKIEGLPDMIMVGRSPSDIKQQLRKIVKQPSMIDSVDRMPKSQVRKMYRDLAGGKDIDEAVHHIDQHDNTDTDFINISSF